jgi:hypothetical protein
MICIFIFYLTEIKSQKHTFRISKFHINDTSFLTFDIYEFAQKRKKSTMVWSHKTYTQEIVYECWRFKEIIQFEETLMRFVILISPRFFFSDCGLWVVTPCGLVSQPRRPQYEKNNNSKIKARNSLEPNIISPSWKPQISVYFLFRSV